MTAKEDCISKSCGRETGLAWLMQPETKTTAVMSRSATPVRTITYICEVTRCCGGPVTTPGDRQVVVRMSIVAGCDARMLVETYGRPTG